MKTKKLVAVITIFALALVIRLIDFNRLMTFGPEQAMSLLISADYLTKPSLLGQPYWRYTAVGHQLFNSPLFNYSLLPLMWLFKFDPVPITGYFGLLNWLTGVLIYVLFHKLLGCRAALIAAILFLFNNLMIFHSRFIWIVHYLPLLGLVTSYWLIKFRFRPGIWATFALGIITGIGWGLDYTFAFFAVPVFLAVFYFSRHKILTVALLLAGLVVGDLPRVIFDLRHGLYTISSLLKYALETTIHPGQGQITYYHFFPFWPVLAIVAAWILGHNRLVAAAVLTGYLWFNLGSSVTWTTYPVSIAAQKQTAKAIADDHPTNFNIVSLVDFDTRGHILRYLLRYPHGLTPQPVDQYSQIDAVYALAPLSYDLTRPANYELTSFSPYQIKPLLPVAEQFILYKLTK